MAPAVDDNNRYLKLTVLEDRVRLAYTVYFGQVPGRALRGTLDADRDGRLSDAEQRTFVARLATEIAAQLALEIDGAPAEVQFSQRAMGGAEPGTQGAFSVDLIATLCVAPRTLHRVRLRDRFRLPRPGETELVLEDGPGVTVRSATVGKERARQRHLRFAGHVPALAEPGLELEVAIDASAPRAAPCRVDDRASVRARPRWWLGVGAAACALALIAGVGWRAARRRRAGG